MKKEDLPPLINITPSGENFTMENCEFIDNGSGRPLIKNQAKGTKLINTKFTISKTIREIKKHPWKSLLIAIIATVIGGVILLGIEYSFFVTKGEKVENNLQVIESPNSVNIAGSNNTVNKLDLPRPKVGLKPYEINIPNSNSELGFDSEYAIEITSDYTIATFPLKIKLPESVLSDYISLFNDDVRGERAWYEFELKDGYVTFTITNASGEYHLVFAHKNPEQLTAKDISW